MDKDHRDATRPESDRWRKTLDEMGVRWRLLPDEGGGRPARAAADLRERIKELNCLYAISQLTERETCSLEDFLSMVVNILPPSWRYPEIACARIVLGDRIYDSLYFENSRWRISAPIRQRGAPAGVISVHYTQACPEGDESVFLREERYLIEAVAESIGHFASRKAAETELVESLRLLDIERIALKESNIALRTILDRVEEVRDDIQEDVQDNLRRIVSPIIQELRLKVPQAQQGLVALLEENLGQITSPFIRQLATAFTSLTPTEIKICSMIRSGLSSKEIASMRGVATATISRHRENIRRKLGLANKKVNLAAYLQSTM